MTSKNSLPSGVAARLGFLAGPVEHKSVLLAGARLDDAEAALNRGDLDRAEHWSTAARAVLPKSGAGSAAMWRRYEAVCDRVILAKRAAR